MPNDTAASDLIAVMTLIAVFVTAVAILGGVTLLSSPPSGDAAPAMLARSVVGEDGKLSIRHDGGDPPSNGNTLRSSSTASTGRRSSASSIPQGTNTAPGRRGEPGGRPSSSVVCPRTPTSRSSPGGA
ncbi:hypothetical protein [Methanoculleus chikugoensis]|uniref:hypothetical protein n=1 Tax=Methanoculleus chikugoensis TaxID=118126 RepID=UPI0006D0392A|nr:hypothetical protein [Methanoculleus chikugoensis]